MINEDNVFYEEYKKLEYFKNNIQNLSHEELIKACDEIYLEFKKIITHSSILVKTGDSAQRKLIKMQDELKRLNIIFEKRNTITNLELAMAKDIQQGILPDREIIIGNYKIIYSIHYLHDVGGDFVEVVKISDNDFAILLADASGHGIPAAMMTMLIKLNFLNNIFLGNSPIALFKSMNETFTQLIKTADYFTAFLLILSNNGQITFANAGHKPGLIYRSRTKQIESLTTKGMFVGLIEDASDSYNESFTNIESGDRLFLFTDGLIETRNLDDPDSLLQLYTDLFRDNIHLSLKELNILITNTWRKINNITDDVTFLLIECL